MTCQGHLNSSCHSIMQTKHDVFDSGINKIRVECNIFKIVGVWAWPVLNGRKLFLLGYSLCPHHFPLPTENSMKFISKEN